LHTTQNYKPGFKLMRKCVNKLLALSVSQEERCLGYQEKCMISGGMLGCKQAKTYF